MLLCHQRVRTDGRLPVRSDGACAYERNDRRREISSKRYCSTNVRCQILLDERMQVDGRHLLSTFSQIISPLLSISRSNLYFVGIDIAPNWLNSEACFLLAHRQGTIDRRPSPSVSLTFIFQYQSNCLNFNVFDSATTL